MVHGLPVLNVPVFVLRNFDGSWWFFEGAKEQIKKFDIWYAPQWNCHADHLWGNMNQSQESWIKFSWSRSLLICLQDRFLWPDLKTKLENVSMSKVKCKHCQFDRVYWRLLTGSFGIKNMVEISLISVPDLEVKDVIL